MPERKRDENVMKDKMIYCECYVWSANQKRWIIVQGLDVNVVFE